MTLLNYMRDHGVPINIKIAMNNTEIQRALTYGAYYLVVMEREFAQTYLAEQLREGHVAIYPWEHIKHQKGFWISPLHTIPQTVRKHRLIYYFYLSSHNKEVNRAAPKEVMKFGRYLHHLLD